MRNHNHLLGRVEGVDGIKTGFTNASGFNLVTSVKRGERQIVAVVLGGRSSGQRDARMRSLIETHIAEASTRRTRVAQNAASPRRRQRAARHLPRSAADHRSDCCRIRRAVSVGRFVVQRRRRQRLTAAVPP